MKYLILAEPAGLAPHSNVYLSVPGGGVVFDKTVFPAYGGGCGLVGARKVGVFVFCPFGGSGGPGGVNYPRPVGSNATIVYPSPNAQVKP